MLSVHRQHSWEKLGMAQTFLTLKFAARGPIQPSRCRQRKTTIDSPSSYGKVQAKKALHEFFRFRAAADPCANQALTISPLEAHAAFLSQPGRGSRTGTPVFSGSCLGRANSGSESH
jgi:hypothetical protein